MRVRSTKWIEWTVAGLLLGASITAAALVLAPRWPALSAGEITDGKTTVAVTWDGATELTAASETTLTVLPAADWYVRPGLRLTSPDRTVQMRLESHPRSRAEQLRDEALATLPAASRREQRETLVTGAEVYTITQGADTLAILELPCLAANPETAQADEVLWVTVSADTEADLTRTRVALGQLLETVCPVSAPPPVGEVGAESDTNAPPKAE